MKEKEHNLIIQSIKPSTFPQQATICITICQIAFSGHTPLGLVTPGLLTKQITQAYSDEVFPQIISKYLIIICATFQEKCGIIKKYCIFWIIFLVLHIIGFLKTLFHMDAGHVIAQILFIGKSRFLFERQPARLPKL